jgi:hypothetical protein
MTDYQTIGDTFAALLREWLEPHEWDAMRRENAECTDPRICASGDYCDSNMAMADAFEIHNVPLWKHGGDWDNEDEGMREDAFPLWNAAWNYAKAKHLTEGSAA